MVPRLESYWQNYRGAGPPIKRIKSIEIASRNEHDLRTGSSQPPQGSTLRSSTTALGPASPAIQPCLRVLHRLRAHSSGSVLLQIPSTSRSHLLIAVLPNVNAGEFTIARLNVLEINNMTSNLTALEAPMSPELDKSREYCGWNILA